MALAISDITIILYLISRRYLNSSSHIVNSSDLHLFTYIFTYLHYTTILLSNLIVLKLVGSINRFSSFKGF